MGLRIGIRMVFGSSIVLRWGLGFGIGNGGLRFRIGDWYWGLLLGKQRGDKDWLLFVIFVSDC